MELILKAKDIRVEFKGRDVLDGSVSKSVSEKEPSDSSDMQI